MCSPKPPSLPLRVCTWDMGIEELYPTSEYGVAAGAEFTPQCGCFGFSHEKDRGLLQISSASGLAFKHCQSSEASRSSVSVQLYFECVTECIFKEVGRLVNISLVQDVHPQLCARAHTEQVHTVKTTHTQNGKSACMGPPFKNRWPKRHIYSRAALVCSCHNQPNKSVDD